MLKIYHMPGSRSSRVIWAAEELGLPYETVIKHRAELKLPDFLAINPMGGAPAIQDGAVTMSESVAIVQYLVGRYDEAGRLAPAGASDASGRYLQWLHFPEANLMPAISTSILASGAFGTPVDEAALAAAKQKLALPLGYVDDVLGRQPYIAGSDLSAADIALYWSLAIGRRFGAVDHGALKNIAAYAARLEERPALQVAMAIPEGFVNQPPGSIRTPARTDA